MIQASRMLSKILTAMLAVPVVLVMLLMLLRCRIEGDG
jgi:hypothetical protein